MKNDIKKIIQRLNLIEKRVADIERSVSVGMPERPLKASNLKKLSLREFFLSKKTNNDVEKTLAIGYYLEKLEGFKSFNIGDLTDAFERAKEKKPININDKVNMNIRNGHMEEALEKKDNRKAWYLTNSGEQFVENNFNK